MTAMLQLNPPIWVFTPLGEGFALVILDYGPMLNSIWMVHLLSTGYVVHVDSAEIQIGGNAMWDIPMPKVSKKRRVK